MLDLLIRRGEVIDGSGAPLWYAVAENFRSMTTAAVNDNTPGNLRVDRADRVATITLNRPDRLNSFNRTMCEEMQAVWRIVKLDEATNAVVLRAAGSRAFSAGLDVKSDYGQDRKSVV